MNQTQTFQRFNSARTYSIIGVVLVAFGMLVGEIYAIYISHVANGVIGLNWVGVMDAVAHRDFARLADHFAVIEDLATKRGRTMHSHSHLGALGLLALALSLLQSRVNLAASLRDRLPLFYLAGSLLHVGGNYASYYAGSAFFYLADLGTVLLVAVIVATLWGLKGGETEAQSGSPDSLVMRLQEPACRYLVKAGILLMIIGMTFGLYYAWQLVQFDEPAVYQSVQDAAANISTGKVQEATQHIQHFKRMQSKIAITAAAHSHAVEFGFLMLLLAFIQKFIFLSPKWKLRWAQTFSVGAFILPLCVLLATKYGLRAAGFSDLFGGIALLGLCAMIFGLVRYTGAVDTSEEGKPL